jgi:aspartokinase
MITIPTLVEELVHRSPFLEEVLADGLINHSALARQLKPEIENKLYKDVQLGAIIVALNRLSVKLKPKHSEITQILSKLGDITLRSQITSFTFANSVTLRKKQAKLLEEVSGMPNSFVTVTDGVFETAFFVSKNIAVNIEESFKQEELKKRIDNLSSITIVIPEEALHIPGVYYSILKKLAWNGINFIEVVSSFTELTIFLETKDVDRAFSALNRIH